MQVGQLTVNLRSSSGKGPARQLRAAGKVPGVCYGASTDGPIAPFPIVVDVKALRAALDPVRRQNTVINLTVTDGDKAVRTLSALLKEYQVDPVRRDVTHVDLLAIDPNKEVTASVPLEFVGKPAGAIDGGQLHTVMRSLQVRAKPSDIPVKLTLDVSPLKIGDVFHVSDIGLPDGVVSVTGAREAVISLVAPEVEKASAAEAAAEGAEAKAAPGKEAKAAPAKGDAKGAAKDAKAAPAKAAAKK
ncbi:MAG TPA: 50S ribosomal protein L25 [Kofleriaceae bacterium]|jgi:large subunit ribosomal protein L25|nr:50S ribosomal protein L25 [Kofleriaceae bacterium]